MNTNFDRVFKLAKKSNSRLVVFDKQEGEHFVVLGVDDFESLLDSPAAAKPALPPEPTRPVAPAPEVPSIEQIIDSDREQDALLLQKLNQQIADWRREEQKKVEVDFTPEPEVPQEPEPVRPEPLPKPTQPVTIPVKIEPEPEFKSQPQPVKPSGSWHKLGDVMAGSSLAKVSYEPLGEQGIKPVMAEETNEYAEPEPLNEDPVFLEEPLS